jgi:hypothetical protein
MPARMMMARIGSSLASASRGDGSRSAAKTARGAWKTASVRSHHRFSGLCSGAGCASALTRGA